MEALIHKFSLPGQPVYETNSEIVEYFGGGDLNDPLLLVARAGDGESFDRPQVLERFARPWPWWCIRR